MKTIIAIAALIASATAANAACYTTNCYSLQGVQSPLSRLVTPGFGQQETFVVPSYRVQRQTFGGFDQQDSIVVPGAFQPRVYSVTPTRRVITCDAIGCY